LTLKGEKSHTSKTEGNDFVRQERSFTSFRRMIGLPRDADLDSAKAELKHGPTNP
jgi:HSP20 family protein